jgi:AraC-like DNA-binding protein
MGMEPRDDHVLAASLAALMAVAERYGISVAHLADAAPLSLADLIDPEGSLSETLMLALWKALTARAPGRSVGLELVSRVPLSMFGPLAHGMRFARDLRQALELLVELRHVLAARLTLTLHPHPAGLAIRMHHPLDELDGGHGAELALGIGARFAREELGYHDAIESICFAHAPTGPAEGYARVLGVRVSFATPWHEVVYRRDALSRPNPTADPAQFLFIKQHIARVHAARLAAPDAAFAGRVRAAVARSAMRGEYVADAVARELGLSLRTLQRRARDHGIDLRGTLEEVREATARALLRDTSLSIDHVAERTGYATQNAFRRAFKRWTGTTPAELRRSETRSPAPSR